MPNATIIEKLESRSEHAAVATLALAVAIPERNRNRYEGDSTLNFLRRNFIALGNLKFALLSFVVNTLRRRFHNSALGFAWSLLNPLLTMGVMAVIFSLIFHQDPVKFTVYVFCAMLPWSCIIESGVGGSTALISYESFLKKLQLPKTFFPLVVVCIATANFVFSMVALMLLGVCCGMQVSASWMLLPAATLVLFLFNFGFGLLLSVVTLYCRDLTHIVTVVLNATFYAMPIIYPVAQMPEQYRWVFTYNPFYYILCLFRTILYEGKIPPATDWLTPIYISLATLVVAGIVLRIKEKDLIFRL